MKIQIEATLEIVVIEGVPCRRWAGVTEGGVQCDVFTRLIRIREEHVAEFKGSGLTFLALPPRMSNGNLQPGVESRFEASSGLM